MTGSIGQTVLGRKASAGRPQSADRAPAPQRALRLGLARAARDCGGIDLKVEGIEAETRSLPELLDMVPERGLVALLEGPGEGLGLVALSPPALTALIELMTTGRTAGTPPPNRRPTRTDAAMTAGLIDRALAGMEAELAETPDLRWAGGFRYASFLDDPRPLGLLLDDVGYRVFRMVGVFEGGAARGEMLIALPAPIRAAAHAHSADSSGAVGTGPDGAGQGGAGQDWAQALDTAVMGAPVTLTAVLHRLRIPLSAVMGLKAGDLVPVPAAALAEIRLEGVDGRRLGTGKLGQNRGSRAVRLTELSQALDAQGAPEPGGFEDTFATPAPAMGAPMTAPPAAGAAPMSPGMGAAPMSPDPLAADPLAPDPLAADPLEGMQMQPMAMPMADGLDLD